VHTDWDWRGDLNAGYYYSSFDGRFRDSLKIDFKLHYDESVHNYENVHSFNSEYDKSANNGKVGDFDSTIYCSTHAASSSIDDSAEDFHVFGHDDKPKPNFWSMVFMHDQHGHSRG